MGMEYRLFFGSDIDTGSANRLRAQICNILSRDDFGELTILFSSDGGNTDQSLALHYFIDQIAVPLRMHAVGHVGSAAIPVFLASKNQTAEPSARFFFHEYHWTFEGSQTLNRIHEAVQRLGSDIDAAKKIIRARTDIPDDILHSVDGSAGSSLIEAKDAKRYGLIDDLLSLGTSGRDGTDFKTWSA